MRLNVTFSVSRSRPVVLSVKVKVPPTRRCFSLVCVKPNPLLWPRDCHYFNSLLASKFAGVRAMSDDGKFRFAIDRGGTFTDIYALCPDGQERTCKLLSVDPGNYPDAPTEGIRRILQQVLNVPVPASAPIPTGRIAWIRMGTTVATNALLERKGEPIALVINRGFRDVLFIGNQARPDIFDLEIVSPEVLYQSVVEVSCRVVPAKFQAGGECQLPPDVNAAWSKRIASNEEQFLQVQPVDETDVRQQLTRLKQQGINSVAVVLAHSYLYPDDEITIGKIAHSVGIEHVSLSHAVMPMVRLVPRGFTACADAYLTPHIQKYVHNFAQGFQNQLKDVNVLFMQSDGGLTPTHKFNGSRAVLSGPAGGVVGYAQTSYHQPSNPFHNTPVIGFDMGGTSTDVSRYDGRYEHVFESTTAGVIIQAPQLDINTVAAGGGSVLTFRAGLYSVGPESAGAHPGPVCYRKGGPLAVTDANLALGRLLPQHFPCIFGPGEDQPLDKEATLGKFKELTKQIGEFVGGSEPSIEEVALGFIRVANEAMSRPIRALTQARGHDTSRHILACFGGAGGQHACAIARALGMRTVFVHRYAGILSAYGMALADVVHEAQEPAAKIYQQANFTEIDSRLKVLSGVCREALRKQGFADDDIETEPFLHMRYDGTDCALMCPASASPPSAHTPEHGDFYETFLNRYQSEFGFTLSNRDVIVDDIRVRGVGKSRINSVRLGEVSAKAIPKPEKVVSVYFDKGYQESGVFQLERLSPGNEIPGPAIILDGLSTVLVEPGCKAEITASGDICITITENEQPSIGTELDVIQLSIFSHRFMSIAEQMGRILQRTSISTNIKERLDFSCALFGPDGGLVSNAPHIPVHLGAMQETVQFQIKNVGDEIREGDVILSNHPVAGGSHLPDLTVITPVFYRGQPRPVFFVASRGHHADIGGATPGSMPPHSKRLSEEGAVFKSFFLVRDGQFREKELTERLMEPAKEPGCSGTRNLADNISDLKAQIAANHKGIQLVQELIDIYRLDVVQAYMAHIQRNAEFGVREMLKQVGNRARERTGSSRLQSTDLMDDGSVIKVVLDIDTETGDAICDFTGSGLQVWGNWNAPRAITLSALIYCLRCLVGHDVPLNQGCLKPLKVIIPPGSLLAPSEDAAVVGGNVLTSQRLVDAILRAFEACAASQGCMNNITFGEEGWGYYETVAGGAGAGPGWHGRGGVHVHMTNTRITDIEIVERRYPVIVERFSLRQDDSGGGGVFRGGEGVERVLRFRRPVTLSVLTERRVFRPYGLHGGSEGAAGENILKKVDGKIINLGSKTAVTLEPGDQFCLLTPGGGGYGTPGLSEEMAKSFSLRSPQKQEKRNNFHEKGSVFEYRKLQESV